MKNRPMVFYQEGDVKFSPSARDVSRVRILYPDGTAMWISTDVINIDKKYIADRDIYHACYAANAPHTGALINDKRPKNLKQVRSAMRAFDKAQKFPKAIFLGYL